MICWKTTRKSRVSADLVAEVQAQVIGSAGSVRQQVSGFDQAQQAVQGHGVQHNVFGGQGERDSGQ